MATGRKGNTPTKTKKTKTGRNYNTPGKYRRGKTGTGGTQYAPGTLTSYKGSTAVGTKRGLKSGAPSGQEKVTSKDVKYSFSHKEKSTAKVSGSNKLAPIKKKTKKHFKK